MDETIARLDKIEQVLRTLDGKVETMAQAVTEAIDRLDETITLLEKERRLDYYAGDYN